MPDPLDRSQVIGSGDWIARQLSRTGALMGPADSGSGVERAAFAFGRGGSAAIFGLRDGSRQAVEEGLRGGVSMLVAEQAGASTGNPALAASASLIVGAGRGATHGITRYAGVGKDGVALPLRNPAEGELDWHRFIADALARVLPGARGTRRIPAKFGRKPGGDGSGAPVPSVMEPSGRSAGTHKWPDSNTILNSEEYRSYRAGMDEFGLQPDVQFRKGLGGNPFHGKTFSGIDKLLEARRFEKRGKNPAVGFGAYFHPVSGRKYYLDKGKMYREGEKLPHVDVHRMKDGINLEELGKRRFPLGDELVRPK